VLLADELLLLAIAAENEGWGLHDGEPKVPRKLIAAVAAALLADLALRDRIVLGKAVVNKTPTGEPDLDAALARLNAPRTWVTTVAKTRPDLARLTRLRNTGVLTEYDSPTARPPRRLFAREDGPEVAILARLHSALAKSSADGPTIALLALLRATGLHARWFRGTTSKARDTTLKHLIPADDWISRALTR